MKLNKKHRWIYFALTWLMRIFTGATFIFSGFVKSIDPWGTFYKIQDYIGVMGIDLPTNLVLTGVFALCIYEFCIGIFLLLGCYRKSSPYSALLLMLFMLPLTLWIALKNPVADCGCFGDAFIISNWATFWKNIVLTAGIIWLIKFNNSCMCLIRPYIQWIAFFVSAIFIIIIGLAGYIYQPLIDFRPYPIGSYLISHDFDDNSNFENSPSEDNAPLAEDSLQDFYSSEEMLFVYSKDGKEYYFTIQDELPDEEDGWIFVRRETSPVDKSFNSGNNNNTDSNTNRDNSSEEAHSIQIWDSNGDKEVSQEVIANDGPQILLLMPDLKNVSMAETWKINSLYKWANDHGIDFIGVVSANIEEIENWKDISLAEYPLYTAEDTQIKMLARGNPAVVFVIDGKITWKSSLRALFTEDFQSGTVAEHLSEFYVDNNKILLRIIYGYLIIIGVMMIFSLLPLLAHFLPSGMEKRINTRNEKINIAERRMEERNENKKSGNIVKN